MATEENTTTKMDPTLSRYIIDQFNKSRSAKDVPFEALDFSIYSSASKTVAFVTSEDRLTKWINTMYHRYSDAQDGGKLKMIWEESPSPNDASKTDKISIQLASVDEKITGNLLTIIIYVTTGRIQVQGKYLHQWGKHEFPALLNLINETGEPDDINKFLGNIPAPSDIQLNTQTDQPKADKDKSVALTESIPTQSPARSKSFGEIKEVVATVESELVSLKQETAKQFNQINSLLKEKDNEILNLKSRIAALEATNGLLLNKNNDFKSLQGKQHLLEKKVNKLITKQPVESSPTKTQSKESPKLNPEVHVVSSPSKSAAAPEINDANQTTSDIPSLTADHQEPSIHVTIPTSNSFQPLDQSTNQNTTKPTPVKTISAKTIILCDSNGRHLDINLLCPGISTEYVKCPTLSSASQFLSEHNITSPETFIIHIGTNDIEKASPEEVYDQTLSVLNQINTLYPNCRILLSHLLPRSDHLIQKAKTLNSKLEATQFPNLTNVKHHNLFRSELILYDKKHLNHKGVKLFAKNLKGAFFASKRNSPKRRMNNWNRNTHLFPQQQKPNQMSSYHRTPAPRMNMQAPCIPSASAFQPPFPRTDTPAHTYPIPPFQPNPSWANIASKPPPPSNSTIPGYLKDIINFLHGSIQKL